MNKFPPRNCEAHTGMRPIRCPVGCGPMCLRLEGDKVNAALASAMSALTERDRMWCKAVVGSLDSSGPRLMCDTEKLLHNVNELKKEMPL